MNIYLKRLLRSTMLTIVLIVLNVILLGTFIVLDDSVAASLFGVENPKAKGELLSLYLTAIGGCAVIYGLWLTYMKIGEQMRQNTIADKSNNDTRFGEAIGYLNNDNMGIAIGGAYTLYQLAKDDVRYVPIVANIFSEYLAVNSKNSNKNRVINTIINLLLHTGYSIFSSLKLEFHDTNFNYTEFKNISNVVFTKCTFDTNRMLLVKNCVFNECNIKSCFFGECEDLDLYANDITFSSIVNKSIPTNLTIRYNNYLDELSITTSNTIKRLELYVIKGRLMNINNDGFVNSKIIVYTNNKEKVSINGEKEYVELREAPYTHKTPFMDLMDSISRSLFEDDVD